MRVILLSVAALFALLALAPAAEFIWPDPAIAPLFHHLRQRVLLHDLLLYLGIALACGVAAEMLHRIAPPPRPAATPAPAPPIPYNRFKPMQAPIPDETAPAAPKPDPAPAPAATDDTKPCPDCGHILLGPAIRCRHCGHDFLTPDSV